MRQYTHSLVVRDHALLERYMTLDFDIRVAPVWLAIGPSLVPIKVLVPPMDRILSSESIHSAAAASAAVTRLSVSEVSSADWVLCEGGVCWVS
jgi:hypothetical protein